MERAAEAYQNALRAAQRTGDERDLSVSQNKIGEVLVAQGEREQALAAYRARLEIRETLARRDPGNTQWQRDLIVSCVKISATDPSEATACLKKALEIAHTLEASGRLAPVDAWMPAERSRRVSLLEK